MTVVCGQDIYHHLILIPSIHNRTLCYNPNISYAYKHYSIRFADIGENNQQLVIERLNPEIERLRAPVVTQFANTFVNKIVRTALAEDVADHDDTKTNINNTKSSDVNREAKINSTNSNAAIKHKEIEKLV